MTLLILVMAIEIALQTQAHLFFAPKEVYSDAKDDNVVASLTEKYDLRNYRILTRNYNAPYSDFGAYWDAISVRKPFSDSYIDSSELRDYKHLKRMRRTATPDWNMVFDIPVIHGYTTLLPQDVQGRFIADEQVSSINNLPEISVDDPQLSEWAVRYYLRDTWFPTYDESIPSKVIAVDGFTELSELEGVKPRVRFEDGQNSKISWISETPNQLRFNVYAANDADLIIADRYDKDWRATINGRETEIQNYNGMRKIKIDSEENEIRMWYEPRAFYYGALASLITVLGSALILYKERKK